MKKIITHCFFFFAIAIYSNAQKIGWSNEKKLSLTDYQSASTAINDTLKMFSIGSGAHIDLSIAMTTYEFAATKNFNSKVKAIFDQEAAYIIAPNQKIVDKLLLFGQYQFDLNELYARKLRKSLYDKKELLSSMEYFQPVYDSLLMVMNEEFTIVRNESTSGLKMEVVAVAHQKVTNQIAKLSDFCFNCTPPKKAKK